MRDRSHDTYADLRPSKALCRLYADAMNRMNYPVNCKLYGSAPGSGSSDMGSFHSILIRFLSYSKSRSYIGNASYVCPGFHASFGIPTPPGAYNHTRISHLAQAQPRPLT